MSLDQWTMLRERPKPRKQYLAKSKAQVQRIINHKDTQEITLSQYPKISSYLNEKFPKVDLSHVHIYIVAERVIEKNFPGIGGCFFPALKIIFVKNEIKKTKIKGKFNRLLQEACPVEITVEDVLVHELIHAVSDKMNRSSAKYKRMEEDFVYTNCIDFYKSKGMTEEDIVNNVFLSFCIWDIASSKDMRDVFTEANVPMPSSSCGQDTYKSALNKNAEVLIPVLKSLAQERGYRMIQLYNGSEKAIDSQPMENSTALRFGSLDLGG